jgi:hypothetical protein
MKISASAIELGFEDYFWDSRDSVFVNGFFVSKSPCAQNMSSSAVELRFLDDFWSARTQFLSTVFVAAVLYVD